MKKTSGFINRLKEARHVIPAQFWVLIAGALIISAGSSMVWPFLSSYLKVRLDVPLTTITVLLALNSVMEITFSFFAGFLTDRFGRKKVMVISLLASFLYYLLMGQSGSLLYYGVLLVTLGAMTPLYTVGLNAMVADIVPEDYRLDAYSFIRIAHNIGLMLGPILGGILAVEAINGSFYGASSAFMVLAMFFIFIIRETLQKSGQPVEEIRVKKQGGGYSSLLKDRVFLGFVFSFVGCQMAASLMFILLQVYTKEQFAMPEDRFGYIVTVNALMVILFQYLITRFIRGRRPLPVLAVGGLFYAVGVGSVALGKGFWGFVISMAVMTIGELIMTPTGTSLVASLAPFDMRGRYMGVYNLIWPVASGVGPILGGLLYDNISPVSIWIGGFFFGLLSSIGFLLLWRKSPALDTNQTSPATT